MKTQISAEKFITDSATGGKIVFYECDPRKNEQCRKSACKPLSRGDTATGCDITTDPKARAAAGKAFYIYCTPGPRVKFSRVYISRGRDAIKPALKAAKWAAIGAVSLLLFIVARDAALRERGYEALGGEYMILLLPVVYYEVERVVKDWIADLRELKRKGRRE